MQEVERLCAAVDVMLLLLAYLTVAACGQESVEGGVRILEPLLRRRDVDVGG